MYRTLADYITGGLVGFSIMDLINGFDVRSLADWSQFILALGGIIYLFGIKIPHDYKMNKLNRIGKDIENEIAQQELEHDE
tara:strand:+ start:141 stop:383 length:243 start_codon:yes stop_codon:yes gene_type:complete